MTPKISPSPTMDNSEPWNNLLACTHFFITLQAMEPLLKPHLRVKITRSTESKIYFSIHAIGSTKYEYSTTIKAKSFTNQQTFNTCINTIWQEIISRNLTITNRQPANE
jgi:hypothetical protein